MPDLPAYGSWLSCDQTGKEPCCVTSSSSTLPDREGAFCVTSSSRTRPDRIASPELSRESRPLPFRPRHNNDITKYGCFPPPKHNPQRTVQYTQAAQDRCRRTAQLEPVGVYLMSRHRHIASYSWIDDRVFDAWVLWGVMGIN